MGCVAQAKEARDLMDPGLFDALVFAGWTTLLMTIVGLIFYGAFSAIKKVLDSF
jgi:hypothetical protein